VLSVVCGREEAPCERARCIAARCVSAAPGRVLCIVSNCHALNRLGSTAVENLPTDRSGRRAIMLRVGARDAPCLVVDAEAVEVVEVHDALASAPWAAAAPLPQVPLPSACAPPLKLCPQPGTLGDDGSLGGSTIEGEGTFESGMGAAPTGLVAKSGLSSTGGSGAGARAVRGFRGRRGDVSRPRTLSAPKL